MLYASKPCKRRKALARPCRRDAVLSTMVKDTETQAVMVRLADDYHKLADRAELRAIGERPASH
jgi:hypothetical protein